MSLVFIQLTSYKLRKLQNHCVTVRCLSHLQGLLNLIFQHDSSQTARTITQFLEKDNVDILPWSARCPDLSSIEHVCDLMRRQFSNLRHPRRNLSDLRLRLEKARDELHRDTINHLIESMPRRVIKCIRKKDGSTRH
jgi:hypothetical protein